IDHAVAGQLTFLANRRYASLLKTTRASAVFIEERVNLTRDADAPPLAALRTPNPYLAFAKALELFHQAPSYKPGIHPTAVIATTARIADSAHIGPYCFVDEQVEIGANAVLHSFVSIYHGAKIGDQFFAHAHTVVREHCRIGDRVILQNGAVIGSDGFGFAKQKDGSWYKIVQSGPAVLEDDVEIQANSCVNRATIGETRIGRGAKLDDLVLVGHASKVGANTLLCGQVGLAGSTIVGDNCIFAGQSASSGHLKVGNGVIVTAQSGLPGDVEPGAIRSGSPAIDNRLWLKVTAALNRLPELQKRVNQLEREIEELGRTKG
ncbi:MAG TPA: UDP-3-O-(3-hydroxymyristoyl)glucosamine N-acyltransferase, partial [Candidatus Acidoferrum sp.]|nr:UDP-3-O-(3-hydroxymyristoyl)glucosamine N-acyltransferase [Candidatus Acidoferrum sp.]